MGVDQRNHPFAPGLPPGRRTTLWRRRIPLSGSRFGCRGFGCQAQWLVPRVSGVGSPRASVWPRRASSEIGCGTSERRARGASCQAKNQTGNPDFRGPGFPVLAGECVLPKVPLNRDPGSGRGGRPAKPETLIPLNPRPETLACGLIYPCSRRAKSLRSSCTGLYPVYV